MRFINFFKDGTVARQPDARHEYNPSKGTASYIWDLPDQHHVLFLVEDEFILYEWTRADGTTEKARYLGLCNSRDSKSGAVQLFTSSATRISPARRDTVMQRIFPDRSEVTRLGHVNPDTTNRMPEKTDLSTFTEVIPGHSRSHARRFVDVAVLIHWKPDLNHDLLPDFIDHPTGAATISKFCACGATGLRS